MPTGREVDRLRAEVDSTIAGDPWYGLSILKILDGVDAVDALAHQTSGSHSIWQLVLHITSWTKETTRRIKGGRHEVPVDGDWPPVNGADAASWTRVVAELGRAHGELSRALVELDDSQLDRQVGDSQVDAHGQPVTLRRTVIGLLQHDAYHAGQVALLKKLRGATLERSA
jgi:uncharacterized damage-inducible protein DinB